jgi:hypothetical protein
MPEAWDQIADTLYHSFDFLWLPAAWLAVPKAHRWNSVLFVLACLLTLRAQVALMESTGYDRGFTPFMQMPAYPRAVIIYSAVIAGFIVLARFSSRTGNLVFFAAALNIYILSFCVSMLLMAL